MPGEERGAADVHGAEPVDDAAGEVLGDRDGRRRRAERRAQQQDAGDHVVDVMAGGVERAAEEVDEQQHQQNRQRQRHEQRVRRPDRDADGAAHEHARVREGPGCDPGRGEVRHERAPGRRRGRRFDRGRSRRGRRRRAWRCGRRTGRGASGRVGEVEQGADRRGVVVRREAEGARVGVRGDDSRGHGAAGALERGGVAELQLEPRLADPRLELGRRAAATTTPASSTATSSASRSASSRYCVVSSTLVPAATSSRTPAHTACRLRGSRPVVGSSRTSTCGRTTTAAARSSRRRIPPDQVPTRRSAASARSKRSSSSPARRPASRRESPRSAATSRRFSRPVRTLVDGDVLPGQRERATDLATLPDDVEAGDLDAPGVRGEQRRDDPDRRRLARPVGPEQGQYAALRHLEIDPLQHRMVGVGLGQAPDLDGARHGAPPLRMSYALSRRLYAELGWPVKRGPERR